ncbi:MAG: adenosine kinase [Bacteroidales bacterium]|jgi:sugar/nucleoside kinase (ribokinase family)|nr:adenosine kinase [Bacteroidales bacterium]MDD4214053.1 adenosine kinase [Bacteroidales bacterium]
MKKILGIGNALVDIMTLLESEDFLKEIHIKKGSMQLVDFDLSSEILSKTDTLKKELSSGGSAANTIHGIANLGISSSFIGKVGRDNYGLFFADDMRQNNIIPMLFEGSADSGRAIALISPDSERTFATYLGAAIELTAEDLSDELFEGHDYLYLEGYLVQNRALINRALTLASQHKLKVCLDLASYNVVEQNVDFLNQIIRDSIDIVFANEEEALALCGKNPDEALNYIAEMCDIAVVKTGKNGSLVKRGDEIFKIQAVAANCIDTTGAGDAYAAGFIYGLAHNLSLDKCGAIGSLIAAKVIEVVGAKLDTKSWERIKKDIEKITKD